jgi:predicted aspartyl protease
MISSRQDTEIAILSKVAEARQVRKGQRTGGFAMNLRRNGTMGRFAVDIELASNEDLVLAHLGMLSPDKVRRVQLPGIVDCGATRLIIPESVAQQLGLPVTQQITVKYADERTATRPLVSQIWLKLQGREGLFNATVEPKRTTALIGAIVLEDLDFLVDAKTEILVPRDPNTIISEAE